jgi:hypothetical protein
VSQPVTSKTISVDAGAPRSWDEARGEFERADTCWLATVRPDGAPHVVPVLAVWVGGRAHFVAGEGTRKAQHLRRDPRCVLTAAGAGVDLLLEGRGEVVDHEERLLLAADAYASKYEWRGDSPCRSLSPHGGCAHGRTTALLSVRGRTDDRVRLRNRGARAIHPLAVLEAPRSSAAAITSSRLASRRRKGRFTSHRTRPFPPPSSEDRRVQGLGETRLVENARWRALRAAPARDGDQGRKNRSFGYSSPLRTSVWPSRWRRSSLDGERSIRSRRRSTRGVLRSRCLRRA